jgi:alpha-1,2-mannosyltransferase
LNIVLYNIFSGPGKGPDIYGTEPWHFYIRNLLLNFNIWFILAVSALPLFLLLKFFTRSKQTGLRTIVFMSPFYLWLLIFTLQPHKEERFMYPAYPALALNAAMALHIILATFGQSDPKTFIGKIPVEFKFLLVASVMMTSVNISMARMYGIYEAYSAPMEIYDALQLQGVASLGGPGDTVCIGKDWYRFPTSYFLPNGMKAKFIKSEFDGLLPGEFSEAKTGFGVWPGTWLVPSGMNDENKEDMSKYVSPAIFLPYNILTQYFF